MTTNHTLLYLGSLLPLIWGVAHLIATRPVVEGFGNISEANRHIITMEWIVEGMALIFIALVVASVTYLDYRSASARTLYGLAFIMLNALSVVSLFTGFKVKSLPFKLCPLFFTTASLLILAGGYGY